MKVIYFDGVCVLCNNFIKWVIDQDKEAAFKFSMIGGESHSKLILNYPHIKEVDSVVYDNGEGVYLRGEAIRKIIHDLSTWKLLKLGSSIVPIFLLNFYYNFVAQVRYKVFGKYDVCPPLPTEWRGRFIP